MALKPNLGGECVGGGPKVQIIIDNIIHYSKKACLIIYSLRLQWVATGRELVEVKMSKHLAAHILFYLQLTNYVFCGPLPPNHLKCERSLAGLKQEQLEEVHKQATVTTDNPNPLLSWNIQHTGKSHSWFAVIL